MIYFIDKTASLDYFHKKLSGQQGSNPGGLYEGTDGVKRYVKEYNDELQMHGEHLSNNIYRDLGIHTPNTKIVKKNNVPVYTSEWLDKKRVADPYDFENDPDIAKKLLKGFGVDVLTANWDVLGLTGDNIGLLKDGEVSRLDNGSAFFHRANAGRKPQRLLHQLSEWEAFADPSINAIYSTLFDTSRYWNPENIPDIKEQLKKIVALRDKNNGWMDYVVQHTEGLDRDSQRELAHMLEVRTRLLKARL